MCLPHSDDFQHTLACAFVLCGLKSLPHSVDNLFMGISFSHEDKIDEHTQQSLLLGRRTKGNFARCFCSFLKAFERGFLQKISYCDGKE